MGTQETYWNLRNFGIMYGYYTISSGNYSRHEGVENLCGGANDQIRLNVRASNDVVAPGVPMIFPIGTHWTACIPSS